LRSRVPSFGGDEVSLERQNVHAGQGRCCWKKEADRQIRERNLHRPQPLNVVKRIESFADAKLRSKAKTIQPALMDLAASRIRS
jgi:hypothetical protein